MTAARRFATRLLLAVARHVCAESREWAEAMLRELDFIESDWEALLWALGSARAMCRHVGRERQSRHEEARVNEIGKKAVGMAEGVGMAVALLLLALGVMWMGFRYFPSWGLEQAEWKHVLLMIVIPETIFVAAIIGLWRRRRPMAVGILLSAAVLATHVIVHLATH
jgi:hypothetical protein